MGDEVGPDLNWITAEVERLTTWPRVQWFAYEVKVRGEDAQITEDRVVVDREAVLDILKRAALRAAPEPPTCRDCGEALRLTHTEHPFRDGGCADNRVEFRAAPEPPRPSAAEFEAMTDEQFTAYLHAIGFDKDIDAALAEVRAGDVPIWRKAHAATEGAAPEPPHEHEWRTVAHISPYQVTQCRECGHRSWEIKVRAAPEPPREQIRALRDERETNWHAHPTCPECASMVLRLRTALSESGKGETE